jgi:PEP-CTERM/exosortase A-associated glycosyltransferase
MYMRILHVFDHSIPLQSGYAFRSLAILESQRNLGWEIQQMTGPKHKGADRLEEDINGFLFFRTPRSTGIFARTPILQQAAVVRAMEKRLQEMVQRTKPSIIHAHSPALNGLAALRVGRKNAVPVVYEVRAFWEDAAVDHGTSKEGGLRYRLTKALETFVLKRVDAVTVICEGLRDDIIMRGITPGKVTVIPNAVDEERFRRKTTSNSNLKNEWGLKDREVIGYIGSFYAYEGLMLFIQALRLILKAKPLVKVLLVGGGPQRQDLEALTKELGLSEHVGFTGRVPQERVEDYYDVIDVLVYPRLSMRLTDIVTPLKPLEAMARGKVVVASDVGGHRELIVDGSTGFIFEAGNALALAETLLVVLQRKSSWPKVIEEARRFVETERSWRIIVQRYRAVYESAIRNSHM